MEIADISVCFGCKIECFVDGTIKASIGFLSLVEVEEDFAEIFLVASILFLLVLRFLHVLSFSSQLFFFLSG